MIEEINIRDLGVIEEARLTFKSGLNVLTGETGAGKTMVLTALGLLLGERSDSSSVRRGQESASVEGRWFLNTSDDISARLDEAGVSLDEGELILNRSVSSEGRSRASAAGRAVPVNLLSEIGQRLVVVHGQSDQIRLKSAVAQREALDQFAGPDCDKALSAYQSTFRSWRACSEELAELKTSLAARLSEAEELRATVAELEAANLQPGEDALLAEQAARLGFTEELRVAATSAHEYLSTENFDDSTDAVSLLGSARKSLESVANHDPSLASLAERLREIGFQVNDLAAEISSYLTDLESEGALNLEAIQERRALINGLKRKHDVDFDELLTLVESSSDRLLSLDSSGDRISLLESQESELRAQLEKDAQNLHKIRETAGQSLASQVTKELATLAMGGATLVVQVVSTESFTIFGSDSIEILLSSYPGAEPRPLGKGASGGELSRIMLAIEVVLAQSEQAPTFIFDEVDAGVGGAAAIEVGRRLAKLAQQAQVIVVTHLAQVAAFATHHLQVMKNTSDSFTASDVRSLSNDARVGELARMLSGLADSDSARVHASELLELARAEFT